MQYSRYFGCTGKYLSWSFCFPLISSGLTEIPHNYVKCIDYVTYPFFKRKVFLKTLKIVTHLQNLLRF